MELSSYHKKLCELQLIKEHKDICWRYRIPLLTPIIHISSRKDRLGEWCPEKRQISISEFLIANYSWDCTVQIFKHEMSHQIVTDLFKCTDDKPHGESFYRACQKIGCVEPYSSATGDLPESERLWTQDELPTEYKTILQKIDKLLSLARSDNEHEAHLAMQRAHELQQKYNLKQLDILTIHHYRYKIIELNKKRVTLQQSLMASLLQDFYMVQIIHSDLYDPFRGTSFKTFEILGTPENISNAEYVYQFLTFTIDNLWKKYQKENSLSAREKRSYQYGLLKGFRKKMHAYSTPQEGLKDVKDPNERTHTPPTSQITAIHNRLLKAFVTSRFPRLTHTKNSGGQIYRDAYETGLLDGHKIIINKGVSAPQEKTGKLYITGKLKQEQYT